MRDNWIRNSSGHWINLDRIEFVQINETFDEEAGTCYQILAYKADEECYSFFEEKTFESQELAQDHLDRMMQTKIWD